MLQIRVLLLLAKITLNCKYVHRALDINQWTDLFIKTKLLNELMNSATDSFSLWSVYFVPSKPCLILWELSLSINYIKNVFFLRT